MSQQAIQAAEAKLCQRLSEIQVLQEVEQLILEAQNSKDVLDQVLQKITEACGFELGTILFARFRGKPGFGSRCLQLPQPSECSPTAEAGRELWHGRHHRCAGGARLYSRATGHAHIKNKKVPTARSSCR